ncbi:MAG: restriction endonuclease subunit S [Enterococcus sp.]|nr:restriction endonuclease subunit S [Enterococcus sp.]
MAKIDDSVKKKVPELRFPGFTDDWEERKLSDVANHRGGTAIEKYFDKDGVYKVISIGSYGLNSQYVDQNIRAISNEITDGRVVNSGELTMVLNDKTANGTIIGRTLLVEKDNEYVINQRTEIISPKENFDSNFAYTTLNGPFREKVKRIVQGGTQIYVNYPAVSNLNLELPKIEEQQKIGSFFKQLDDTIALHQRKLDLLKEQKKGFLQKMFPKNGAKVPELRFAGFADDWEERKLSDIVSRLSKSSNNSELPRVEFEDIVSGEGRLNKDVSHKFDDRKGILFSSQNILYGKLRPYLKNWLLADFKGIALGDFWVFKSINSDPKFVYSLIQSNHYQKVANDTSGTKMPRSDWKKVSSTEFQIPSSLEEQKKIGSFFKKLDDTIALHQRKLDLLKEQKKGFLQKMFV